MEKISPGYLKVRDVADLFGRTPGTVRRWIKDGKVRAVYIGRSLYIPASEVNRHLDPVLAIPSQRDGEHDAA